MNAVLAVTRKPELLRRVETWIKRLDTTNTGRSAIHVYHVKYGEARQIARVLNDIFGGGGTGSSSPALDSASGQIAPGSGLSSSSSGGGALSRLSASPNSPNSRSSGGAGDYDWGRGHAARLRRGFLLRRKAAACSTVQRAAPAASPAHAAEALAAEPAACWMAYASPPTPSTIRC